MNYGGFGQKKPEESAASTQDAPKQMNYGGFGQKKEEEPAKVMNYGGFGQKQEPAKEMNYGGFDQKQEPAKEMNYGGFGQKKPEESSATDAPKQMNYGGFGQKQEPAKQMNYYGFGQNQILPKAEGTYVRSNSTGSAFGASKFGGFTMPGTNSRFTNNKLNFQAMEQFKHSLAEVLGGKPNEHTEKIYKNSTAGINMPNMDYLKTKRGSVFHKAFDDKQQLSTYVPPVHAKDDDDTNKLMKLFTSSFLTKNIEQREMKTLADAMFQKKFKAGETIIRYGDVGAEYFVLASGSVKVVVYKPGANPFDPKIDEKISFQKELSAKPDDYSTMVGFGEISLLYNDKRSASVIAVTECDTWVLVGDCFKYIIAQNSIKRRNISLEFLNKVELFNVLEQYDKLKLIDGLVVSHK